MNTLLLRLEGPLQSWGLRARWEERDTAFEPSKSGIIGLLGCALGLHRDNDRLREISEQLTMGVRVERQGQLLLDYHTTGGGFPGGNQLTSGTRYSNEAYVGGVLSSKAPRQGRYMVKITNKTKTPETDVSKRFYLMDAIFLVALCGPEPLIAQLADALQNPVWPLFLGRKACVPTTPLFVGLGSYATLQEALEDQPLSERAEPHNGPLRLILETTIGRGSLRNDTIGVPARRLFWPRAVTEHYWRPPQSAVTPATPPINTME